MKSATTRARNRLGYSGEHNCGIQAPQFNNEYHLLSLDIPEIYRELDTEVDELPLFIDADLPA